MRPYLVVITDVRQQDVTEMALAEHNNVVKAFPVDRTDQPFGICVLPRGAWRRRSVTDAYRKLLTLQDAATHITNLPTKESDLPEWQAAIEALMLVADRRGHTMFARIGAMRALNRHVERVFDPSRKEKQWRQRKLARDQ
jgi:hypothetical protein